MGCRTDRREMVKAKKTKRKTVFGPNPPNKPPTPEVVVDAIIAGVGAEGKYIVA